MKILRRLERQALLWVFLSLLAVNARHLADPVYWDGVIGIYAQGAWLADNELDTVALTKAPSLVEGGPRIDVKNGYAALFAVMTRCLPRAAVFVSLHLLTLAWGAVALALAAASARRAGARWPWVWALCGAMHPIFSAQCAGTYVEVALAGCALMVLELTVRRRFAAAGLVATLAQTVKYSAGLIGLALGTYALMRLIASRVSPSLEARPRSLVWLLLPLAAMLGVRALQPDVPGLSMDWDLARLLRLQSLVSPVLFALFALSLPAVGAVFARAASRQRALAEPGAFWETALLTILCWGYWAALSLHPLALPRYHTLIVLPLLLLWLRLLKLLAPQAPHELLPLLLVIAFGANARGALLPDLPFILTRSGETLERSHEWLDEVPASRTLCQLVAEQSRSHEVVVDWPFVHMLTLPALGYVDAPIPVRAFHPLTWGGSRPVSRGLIEDPRTLVLFVPTLFDQDPPSSLEPAGGSTIVAEQRSPNGVAVLYRGFPIERLGLSERRSPSGE